jgi:hypothetical protein
VAEIMAGREQEELGRDVLTFRREDGIAENFHTSQNRELLEKLAEQTGGRYYTAAQAKKLASEISYSEAGITTRETRDLWDMPVVFLLVLGIRGTEWLLRRMLLASCWAAPAATWHLTVSGLGGEQDYEQRFKMWATDIGQATKTESLVAPTREALRARFAELAKQVKPDDAFVLMLIGHGSFDGLDYKFNLPGPDITASELAGLLDRIHTTRQLVVNMTSASGGASEHLRKPSRVVITATKSGTEKNATVFARYWAEALRDAAADTDKNETVSALEAFEFARKKTAQFYESNKRLATEHPQVDDQKLAGAFPMLRIGASAAAAADPAKRALIDKKEQIEQRIDKLKYEKAAIPAAEYKQQLMALLLELARIQEELDQ